MILVEEAFRTYWLYRGVAGYQLRSARRSLKYSYFKNGVTEVFTYWEIADGYLTLVAGTNEYIGYRSSGDGTSTLLNSAGAALYGTDDIFEASYRSSSALP